VNLPPVELVPSTLVAPGHDEGVVHPVHPSSAVPSQSSSIPLPQVSEGSGVPGTQGITTPPTQLDSRWHLPTPQVTGM
jgi:hypothetical protein